MCGNDIETNQVSIMGTIASEFEFNHEIFGEKFYIADVKVERLSGVTDSIPVMFSDRLIEPTEDMTGTFIFVTGRFCSYNRHEETGNRLILSVFAREVEFVDYIEVSSNSNAIYLDGFICKEPIYRKTPLGREIADLLIAVNRPYGKTDYIPCICWGRNARFSDSFSIGTPIKVWGRIQSREYRKKLNEETFVIRTAYEVSVSKLEVM